MKNKKSVAKNSDYDVYGLAVIGGGWKVVDYIDSNTGLDHSKEEGKDSVDQTQKKYFSK